MKLRADRVALLACYAAFGRPCYVNKTLSVRIILHVGSVFFIDTASIVALGEILTGVVRGILKMPPRVTSCRVRNSLSVRFSQNCFHGQQRHFHARHIVHRHAAFARRLVQLTASVRVGGKIDNAAERVAAVKSAVGV